MNSTFEIWSASRGPASYSFLANWSGHGPMVCPGASANAPLRHRYPDLAWTSGTGHYPCSATQGTYGRAEVTLIDFHSRDLERLRQADRLRELRAPAGHDFSSNDYLGLASSDVLRAAARAALDGGLALGSGGSRLLRGNAPEHEELEAEAARFFTSEGALFLGSGYAANTLVFSTLPQAGDRIFHDELIHASAHEGMRLSRAPSEAFAHNDVDAAADAIERWRAKGACGTPWIAFETLYSMDGTEAPLADFAALADRVGAMLLVDEAHAVGVCGAQGRGLAAALHGRDDTVTLATCGKALGCEGALILSSGILRDFLINRGRGFIFSTAPSPLIAAVVRESLKVVARADDRRERLRGHVDRAERMLKPLGITSTGSHIQPVILGDDARTMRIAAALQARGYDVRGIRPPTVPKGTSRLRLSITLNVGEQTIDDLAAALGEVL